MKNTSCVFILILSFLTSSFARDIKDSLHLKVIEHPRILLLKGEESLIKETIASDKIFNNIDRFILGESDRIIMKPPVERLLIGRRLLDKSREALKRIFYLSYAWRVTSERKYSDRAIKEMLAVSAFSDWNPSHFLDVAEMTMALSIGYDWLFDILPEDSRVLIRNAIVEKGLKPSLMPENEGFVRVFHNWNQVCSTGMTYGALAVFENEPALAGKIINRALGSIKLPMSDYEPDGAYPEGYSYWGYGTSFNVMFLSAIEKAFGEEKITAKNSGFLKTAAYLENMTGPTGNNFNYSDSSPGGWMNPAMFWFSGKLNDPSLLWGEKYLLETRLLQADRLLPSVLIWGSGIKMDAISPPEKLLWKGQGKNPVALMRISWTDRDAIYLGLKAGSPSVNHGHMDAGSFIMEADGVRWAMDFGMQDYNSLETSGIDLWSMGQKSQRWEVYRYNNFVHNTLTINSGLQRVSGYSVITSASGGQGMMNAVTDLSFIYRPDILNAKRGVAIIDNKYVLVRDEIETPGKEAVVRWNMLTPALVTIIGGNNAELTKGGKKLLLKVISPPGAQLTTIATDPPHDYDAPNPGTILLGFDVTIPANSKENLVVLLIPEGAEENRSFNSLTLSEWPGER